MAKADRTRIALFKNPVNGNIEWREVESMLISLGAERRELGGSIVAFTLNNVRAVFHRPHPRRECGKGLVKRVREFLTNAGLGPEKRTS